MVMRAVVAILTGNCELQMKRGFAQPRTYATSFGTTLYANVLRGAGWPLVAFIVRWPRNVLPLAWNSDLDLQILRLLQTVEFFW